MNKNKVRQLERLLATGKITEEQYEEELEKLEKEEQVRDRKIREKRFINVRYGRHFVEE